ncbi:chemotaxis protein CheB [Methylovulum psychrotolerans]|uniref:SAM-dependent methyltransferase n=1 Tax=Methylovulum psychrotolerans TaxID=1704499 RepID=A0A2S5CFZ4_9GAMM|nr:chemotaxis protein CheB [Methylovulum psychrotolerans]POZ49662.1 SAM-dependent methyltransferase [Methylovulum psychrotolerans]
MKPQDLPALLNEPCSVSSGKTAAAFPIVGIGASAGGLEALGQFLHTIPANSGFAFVLVSHLDPSHTSLFTEILQRTTHLAVHEAQDQLLVKRNSVYIIPPNCDMTIVGGKLRLTVPAEPRGRRTPIDTFFKSLAQDQQNHAIGIILSGSGTDGTLGLRAILEAGGTTLVQTPASAKYDGMPSSAIHAGYATHILPIDKMLETLQNRPHRPVAPPQIPAILQQPDGISRILLQLRDITGHDFSLYKKNTIGRRIERRMSQQHIQDTNVYADYLKTHPTEAHSLFKDLLINVTRFFRDAGAFTELEQHILPALCKNQTKDTVFRAWVASCATGEEAYSLAMLLRERMDMTQQDFKVQIYSTDLDDEAIAIAHAGFYPLSIAEQLSTERLEHFFNKENTGYRVKKELRAMVIFAVQNIIKDPPFIKLDLLCCRNLLIYLEPELQNQLIPTFHYALKPDGVLFLSTSESIGDHTDLFATISRKWKFYRALATSASMGTVLCRRMSWAAQHHAKTEDTMRKPNKTDLSEFAKQQLVQFFAPASVVTDCAGNVQYVHGDTSLYLLLASGPATLNIMDLAREGLTAELQAALKAAGEGRVTLNKTVHVKTNNGFTAFRFSVRTLPSYNGQNLLLIDFQDLTTPIVKSRGKRVAKSVEAARIEELEHDLAYLKESQQAGIEELQSTNEELQSTNEELQSTNEELETSKEELQSVNEEIITVNAQLQAKIDQLASMQNDMSNLLESINIGIIFLDQHLKIRSFTKDALSIYRMIPSDIGRPLNDIKSVIAGDELLLAATTVLKTLIPVEQQLHTSDDTWILARIQPYRTLDNVTDGVVLTFTDISVQIRTVAMQQALLLAEGIVTTIQEPFIALDSEFKAVSASQSFYQAFQATPEGTLGRQIYTLANGQWDISDLRQLLDSKQVFAAYVLAHDFPDIGQRNILLNSFRVAGKETDPQLILISIHPPS